MTKNRFVIEQCSYYIGAPIDKIENTGRVVVQAIYCMGSIAKRYLYQLEADLKSSVPCSRRWMTAIFNNI
ncbi:MAG TPA: hypothetical protein VFC69_05620 [Dysgonamonadaceae bacterium]|nr:hypothetical protein [Dysgonamonadaceae bacterium]